MKENRHLEKKKGLLHNPPWLEILTYESSIWNMKLKWCHTQNKALKKLRYFKELNGKRYKQLICNMVWWKHVMI